MPNIKNKEAWIKEWLRFTGFANEAQKFNTEQGSVLNKMDILEWPGGKDKVTDVKRLSHLTDYCFFNMGAIYTKCCVPNDIMGVFREMTEANDDPYEGPRVILGFNTPIFNGMNEWDYMLEGIYTGPEGYDKLLRFMRGQVFRQKVTQSYWKVDVYEVLIPDPMAVDRKEYDATNPEDKALITLFLPSGNHYRIGIKTPTGIPPIYVTKQSPAPAVVQEATAMLNVE